MAVTPCRGSNVGNGGIGVKLGMGVRLGCAVMDFVGVFAFVGVKACRGVFEDVGGEEVSVEDETFVSVGPVIGIWAAAVWV